MKLNYKHVEKYIEFRKNFCIEMQKRKFDYDAAAVLIGSSKRSMYRKIKEKSFTEEEILKLKHLVK